jgi:peptidoglycan/xylan/chitin deacetylase (PgdA/CDA1 family)
LESAIQKANEHCCKLSGQEQEKYLQSLEEQLGVGEYKVKDTMMNFDDLRVLQSEGHTIGSHTITHPNLALIDDEQLRHEMTESKRILESELDTEIVHFSYPNPALYPNWSERTMRIAGETGYKTAVLSEPGPVGRKADLMQIRRMSVPFDFQEFEWDLKNTLAGRIV